MSSRRDLFVSGARGAVALAALSALGACTTLGSLTASQLDTDADAVANAVSTVAIALEQVVPATDAALLTEIETLATTAGQDATALNGLIPVSGSTTATYVAAIVKAITTYDGLLPTYFPASAPIVMVVNVALVVAQQLLTETGITPAASAKSAKMKALAVKIPVATARAYLQLHVAPRGPSHR